MKNWLNIPTTAYVIILSYLIREISEHPAILSTKYHLLRMENLRTEVPCYYNTITIIEKLSLKYYNENCMPKILLASVFGCRTNSFSAISTAGRLL